MIAVGQDPVVEQNHEQGQKASGHQDRSQEAQKPDTAGLGGHDLVVRRQAAKGHEHGDQDGHGHGQGDDPGQVVEKILSRLPEREALAQHLVHHLQDDVHYQNKDDQGEPQSEGAEVLFEDVSGEGSQVGRLGAGVGTGCCV